MKTHGIIIARFLIQNNKGKDRFLKEFFLLADTRMKMILRMLFFPNNADIEFAIKLTRNFVRDLYHFKSIAYYLEGRAN